MRCITALFIGIIGAAGCYMLWVAAPIIAEFTAEGVRVVSIFVGIIVAIAARIAIGNGQPRPSEQDAQGNEMVPFDQD